MSKDASNVDKRPQSREQTPATAGRLNTDNLDRQILRRLQIDGRNSYRKLAADLGVSTTTIANRVARMESSSLIRGYGAVLDFERLGYEITAVTEILVSKGKLLEMEREIAKLPGVCSVYDVTGEIDGIIVAKFKTREELSRFTKGLLSMPFVDRANTHVVLTTVKEDFRMTV
jgi:DNA-binding Lrp family transcriptional regulator